MKTLKLMLAMCVLATTVSNAQFNGQSFYNHGGSLNALLTSGTYVQNIPGFIMGGYLPSVTAGTPNFLIDKVDPDGSFTSGTAFSQQYFMLTDSSFNCIGVTGQETKCYGVTVIESFVALSTVRYAVAAAFNTGILFATLNSAGGVVSSSYYLLAQGWVPTGKPLLTRSSGGSYYVAGNFSAGAQDYIYGIKILPSGIGAWSQLYFLPSGTRFKAHSIVEHNYNSSPELAMVGTLGTTSDDGFFMTFNSTTGAPIIQEALASGLSVNESLSSIDLAAGNSGFIVGGSTDMNGTTGRAWMMTLNSSGIPNWSKRITSSTNSTAGEVIGVRERYSSTYSAYEYYGLTLSTGASGGMLVLKLDNLGNAFSKPGNTNNEFLYNDGTGNIALPAAISQVDQGNGGTNTGIHVFGTDQSNPGQFFMTQAFYNGAAANCSSPAQQNLTMLTQAVPGPTVTYTYTVSTHTGLVKCKQHDLRSSSFAYSPNQPCYTNLPPVTPYTGNNNKTMAVTGIKESTASTTALSVFPNPVSDVMEIRYTNSSAGNVRISISDILGRELKILDSGYKDAGENSLKFDMSNKGLNPGVYFINVDTNGEKSQQKIIYGKN